MCLIVYMKVKSQVYTEDFQEYLTKSGFVHKTEVFADTNPIDKEHNVFSAADRLCQHINRGQIEIKSYRKKFSTKLRS
jgi:hypothetical protein